MQAFHYIYILQSDADPDRCYAGMKMELRDRLARHNRGDVAHTSKYRPWRIKSAIAFRDAARAAVFERYLKTASGRAFAEKRLRLLPNGGDDDVQTPPELAKAIVAHFMPSGGVLEPCRGGGAFAKSLPGHDWCDLAAGRDFLVAKGRCDWIVSNPPYSQFRAFLQKAMQVADNIMFISLVGAWFVRARQEDMRRAGFALVELAELPIPPEWPQFGLELAAGWARRARQGSIAHTRLEPSPTLRVISRVPRK